MLWILILLTSGPPAWAMPPTRITQLRKDTVDMFYHGFDNYMKLAFPEDELRPLTCLPLVRDTNPQNMDLNDVLGNYSLTLVDTLSTLAILASAPPDDDDTGAKALKDFQKGVADLVEQYGDGRPGRSGQGLRARGFDLDSKVQVFETVIRGVGGLLSAHLFAVGELPITGYNPPRPEHEGVETPPVIWPHGFRYDGQLLRLALDLATRLLPAFYSNTGLPYPRVNLRHGVPFYKKSPWTLKRQNANADSEHETTNTCSAGAGSLVLEFTVLSRLTGDGRFEQAAKRAFWAVWERKGPSNLVGSDIDVETGEWANLYTYVGAGVDSFFEYAFKTHVLLSGHQLPNQTSPKHEHQGPDPFARVDDYLNSPESFLDAWRVSHAAIKRHMYNDQDYPHYPSVNILSGAPAWGWVDSLSAYYPGLLVLAGEVDEAIETSLLYTAIWTRYSALPERFSMWSKKIEHNMGYWPLRPEFIESTYYLYRATKDPWYLYVGEMVLRDITHNSRTSCGWARLENVTSGQKGDRMDSFFLGETTKYMFFLFNDEHPLNKLDAAFVFTTEGHPLLIPKRLSQGSQARPRSDIKHWDTFTNTCPAPPNFTPFTGSVLASRDDLYHASRVLGLHMLSNDRLRRGKAAPSGEIINPGRNHGPEAMHKAGFSFFPWTLPSQMLPDNGKCALVQDPEVMSLDFPNVLDSGAEGFDFLRVQMLQQLSYDAIRIKKLMNLQITFRLEEQDLDREWRITRINNIPLGKDQFVVMDRSLLNDVVDSKFNLVRDAAVSKLVLASPPLDEAELGNRPDLDKFGDRCSEVNMSTPSRSPAMSSIKSLLSKAIGTGRPARPALMQSNLFFNHTAITSTGVGGAPLPPVDAARGPALPVVGPVPTEALPWTTFYAAGYACDGLLAPESAREHQVIIMRRGKCSFSAKLNNIPSFAPGPDRLQLVVMVDDGEAYTPEHLNLNQEYRAYAAGGWQNALNQDYRAYAAGLHDSMVRPWIREAQKTPSGMPRRHPISVVMVRGGDKTYSQLTAATQMGLLRRYYVESNAVRIRNLIIDEGDFSNEFST